MRNTYFIYIVITLFSNRKGLWFTNPNTLQASITVVEINSLKKYCLFACLSQSLFPDKTIVRTGIITFAAMGTCFKIQHRYETCPRWAQIFLACNACADHDSTYRLV